MPGAIAIDYCKVAGGMFDAILYAGANRYLDLAAGNLIVKEAGGIVSDFKGNTEIVKDNKLIVSDLLVCGNKKIQDYILSREK